MFQRGFRKISNVFQERLKGVSSNFKGVHGYLKEVYKGVSEVSMLFQCFKGVARVFQGSFQEV